MTTDPTPDAAASAASALQWLFEKTAPDVAARVQPFVLPLLQAQADGHSYIELTAAEAKQLATAAPIVGHARTTAATPLVLQGRHLFTAKLWQLERDLAADIMRLLAHTPAPVNTAQAAADLAAWFGGVGEAQQQCAAALALLSPLMLINGGPGTGKTTTVAKLLALLCRQARPYPRIALAAPTGKAAAQMTRALQGALQRLLETTDRLPETMVQHLQALNGQTLHRLLQIHPLTLQAAFGPQRPLPFDVVVVDEASMIDLTLMRQLLAAIGNGCRLILLGDQDQLPAVGAGAVLAALSRPTRLNPQRAQALTALLPQHDLPVSATADALDAAVLTLRHSHRFAADSGIGRLAQAVVQGDAATALACFEADAATVRLQAQTADLWPTYVALQAAYWAAVDAGDVAQVFARQADLMVLSAWRKEAAAFNQTYIQMLRRQGRVPQEGRWFHGQPVMISRNDYQLGLFNGDVGIILRDGAQQLRACFPDGDGYRDVSPGRLPEHQTAFALTVHKSQGSEYRQVWLLPPAGSGAAFDRTLLYTAITRAREQFVFWGAAESFQAACLRRQTRRSGLAACLQATTRTPHQ